MAKLSTIAMSRALLEYAILERSRSLGFDAYETTGDGKRPKRLARLVYVVAEKFPDAKEDLETVQSYGNEVMHPIKKGNVEVFPAMKDQALDCLSRLRRILTVLYTAKFKVTM